MQTQLLLPIYDNKERLSLKTCCDLLNELHGEYEELKLSNINLEAKVFHLLDILQEKGSMTYEEVHEWWNSEVMRND